MKLHVITSHEFGYCCHPRCRRRTPLLAFDAADLQGPARAADLAAGDLRGYHLCGDHATPTGFATTRRYWDGAYGPYTTP